MRISRGKSREIIKKKIVKNTFYGFLERCIQVFGDFLTRRQTADGGPVRRMLPGLWLSGADCSVGVVRQEIHRLVKGVEEVEAPLAEHGDGIQNDFVEAGDTNDR